MKTEVRKIENIPSILWGEKTDSVFICVHGKMSNKEEARGFAEKAVPKGYQVLSFDLPEHGDRTGENYPCTAWNSVYDLGKIAEFAMRNYSDICLYGSSLGAYFSLLAYKDVPIRKSLFLSPVLDMARLIQNMMSWFSVSEQALEELREIPTPMGETLSWDYYCYARNHTVEKWDAPTAILYGSKDNITEREVVEIFSKRFGCDLSVLEGGEHWFHTERQVAFLNMWFDKHI